MISEKNLTEKLLTNFHISVEEKNLLPNGKIKLSSISKVVEEKLQITNWYPINWRPETPFSGGLIQALSDKKFKVYHKEEVSLMKYAIIEVVNFSNFDKAIVAFLKFTFKDNIDGIPIDYKE